MIMLFTTLLIVYIISATTDNRLLKIDQTPILSSTIILLSNQSKWEKNQLVVIPARARTKVFVLGLFVLFQVKSKSTSIQNIYLDLYLYFQKRTWYLYLYFRQILWYLYSSTKTCTLYFVLKIRSNIFFCNLNTFCLVEIFAVFHNAGAIILRFNSSRYSNHKLMHSSYKNLKLNLILCSFILFTSHFELFWCFDFNHI
jgi:hypothetical protein